MQNMYTASMILNFIIDQVLIGFIESNYKELGEDEVFRLWWGFHLLELLEIHFFANILIVRNIQNIEEFQGYVGKTFPGQDKPRSVFIQPKRELYQITKEIDQVYVEHEDHDFSPQITRNVTFVEVEIHWDKKFQHFKWESFYF